MSRSVALFALALLLLAAAAFWPAYLSKPWAGIDRYTHVHAAFGTLWLLVLVVQPVLMFRGARAAHRAVGRSSLFVAVGFVISGVLLTHFRVSRMTEAVFAKEGLYIYLPLAVTLAFAAACVLGIRWRKSAAVHARFMLSTGLLLLDPVLARIMYFYLPPLPSDHLYQGISFSLVAGAMIVLVHSLPPQAMGRVWYRNYCIGTVAILALFFAVPATSAWMTFVNWFRALPLT